MNKPKCANCKSDLHVAASGYIRRNIKADGTTGYMIMGQEDGIEEFLICSHMKCNTRFELKKLENGKLIRGKQLEG
jgi:hypothetical protein